MDGCKKDDGKKEVETGAFAERSGTEIEEGKNGRENQYMGPQGEELIGAIVRV